jgi:hypothetical protein
VTRRADPVERVRAANPVPVPVEPDWERVKEHVTTASCTAVGSARAESPVGAKASDAPQLDRRSPASGGWNGRRGRRVLGAAALCAVVATGILIVVAPGGSSPDFLARAAAALSPVPDAVLYERWEHTIAPEAGDPFGRSYGPERLWIEDDSPRRYRAILQPEVGLPAEGLAYAYGVNVGYAGSALNVRDGGRVRELPGVLAGEPLELAGSVQAPTGSKHPGEVRRTLTFLPPHELLSARLQVTLGASLPGPHDQAIEDGADPVSALRQAIAEGRAHEAGTTQLDGRTVRRIDIDLPEHPPADAPPLPADAPRVHPEAYAYVEPETFHPVEIVYGRDTYTFLAYEYLPATPANLALTNIHAQHPHATIVEAGGR